MSKTLASFRLTELAKQNLKELAKKHKLSEADVIEAMASAFTDEKNEHLEIHIRSYKLKNSKEYKDFIAKHAEDIKELGISID